MKSQIEPNDYYICDLLDKHNKSYIYGEIIPESFYSILNEFEIENKSLVDIGCGCGRMLFYLNDRCDEIELYGIEIDSNRYYTSLIIQDSRINNDSISRTYDVTFENKDFIDIYFGNYDILYCCNILFENEENNKLYLKLINEFKGVCFLFTYNDKIKNNLHKKYNVDTSWQINVPLYSFIF